MQKHSKEDDDDTDSDVVYDDGAEEPKPDPFGGKTFTELLQEAAKIKGSQMEKKRRVFEKRPEFLKRTLTHHPPKEFDPLRELPGEERLAKVEEWKKAANAIYAKGKNYEAARLKYERALSLFYYVRNTNPKWKKKGLYDEDLEIVEFKGETAEHAKQFYALKITLMLNLALSLLKGKQWKLCKEPLEEVLKLEPENVKALYFRARALSLPPSSGATEFEMAVDDLKKAREAAPDNEQVKKLLDKMVRTKRRQRRSDKKTFGGFFSRGAVVEELPEEQKEKMKTEKNAKTRQDFQRQMDDVENLAKRFEAEGKTKEAKRMKRHLKDVKKKLREARQGSAPQLNFQEPSTKMVEDADKMGLDLKDPQVLAALQELQTRHAAGEDITDDTDFGARRTRKGVPTGLAKRGGSTQQSYYHIIVPVMAAFLLWRLYSLGLLQWLMLYLRREVLRFLEGGEAVEDDADIMHYMDNDAEEDADAFEW